MYFRKVHIVGSSGIGMKPIINILQKKYNTIIEGTDIKYTDGIVYKGIHSEEALSDDVDCMIYSGVLYHMPEVQKAIKLNIPIYHRAYFLNQILNIYIGVTGTHGKTYTTALIGHMFEHYFTYIGGNLIERSERDYSAPAIVEIDESDNTSDYFFPKIGIIVALSHDHLDFYQNEENYLKNIERFANQCEKLIIRYDDRNKISINNNIELYTYGFNINSDIYIDTSGYIPLFNIQISSIHSSIRLNTAAALTTCYIENKDMSRCISFKGVKRRFEIEEYNHYIIINDYAVHPIEIQNIFQMTREKYNKNFTVFFQGHNHARVEYYKEQLIQILKEANELIILPVHQVIQAQSTFIESILHKTNCIYSEHASIDVKNNIVLFVGAGNIQKYIDEFKKYISSR